MARWVFHGIAASVVAALAMFSLAARASNEITRVANTTLTLPQDPQTFGYTTEVAFAGLTFNQPLGIVTAPGETDRLFVVEKTGRVQAITGLNSTPVKSVFLDLSAIVLTASEEGLLGLAFHPNFATNHYIYVFYSLTATTTAGTGDHERVSRFTALPGATNAQILATEVPMISQYDEAPNHNGGDLHFGSDGYLYISVGDEGLYNGILDNTQRIDKDYFSGLLRIDVDQLPGNLTPNAHPAVHPGTYKVPADNPFVGATSFDTLPVNPANVRTEFWAVGLRNPWRFSFDAPTGRLLLGDVGQAAREEIDLITRGGNYGWNYREGTLAGPGGTPPAGASFIDPIWDTGDRNLAGSITGGVVYRGSRFAQLYGQYVFGDYLQNHVFAMSFPASGPVQVQLIATESTPVGFGVDPRNGDILMACIGTGQIKRLVYNSTPTGTPLPATLTGTGAFTDLATLTPAAGIYDYAPNISFWSDYADKQRWFSVPALTDKITFSAEGNWTFPAGTVWVKHFELELTRGDPATARRLETRFLVKTADGIYGVAYKWNPAQTEATLVAEGGEDEAITINDGGTMRTQTWHYPSRSECLECHSSIAGHALGFNTPQLNGSHTYNSGPANQLAALANAGFFTTPAIPDPATLRALAVAGDTTATIEYRARSYLSANCVQCHQPGGAAQGLWDARIATPTGSAGLVNGALINSLGNGANRVIVPGDLTHSVLLTRIGTRGTNQMPPLASNEVAAADVALVTDWINSLAASPIDQPAPTITSATTTNFGAAYAATVNAGGFGAAVWSLGANSTAAGAAIDPSTGVISCISLGTVVINAQFVGDGSHNPSPVSADFTVTVNAAPTTFALSATSFIYNGSAQGPMIIPTPIGATFTPGGATSATNAGPYTATATASGNFTGANNSLGWTINQATAPVVLGNLSATYDGSAHAATATTAPNGLNVTLTYDGSGTVPTNAGSYAVVGTINDANYVGSTNGTLTIGKAAATVSLGNLSATYDGAAHAATATTTPNGFNVTLTYDGSGTVPTNAGSYAVIGTINDANYVGSANGTLTVSKGTATVVLGNLGATYDGSAHAATATTTPNGLNVTLTYDGSGTVPTNAGSYAVVGTINDANYVGSANGTLTISKGTATVSLGNLSATYDGAPHAATATTTPNGLNVTFTYNGSGTAPTNAASYAVVGTINDANYSGTGGDTLVIGKATPVITWPAPSAITYGTPLDSTQLNASANVAGSFAYSPSAGVVLSAGTQTLNATFTPTDTPDYNGVSPQTTLAVNKASLTVTADSKSRIFGAANPVLTISYAGFVNGDTPASLTTQPTATTTAVISSPVGAYPITPAGGVSSNYSFNYVNGTLTVALLVANDFNGDGKSDLLWQNTSTGERSIWLMNGTTFVSGVSLGSIPTEWSIAAVGDFNGDNQNDLVWQNTTTGERSIWLMNGGTFVSGVSLGVVPTEWSIAGAGDFNDDGQTDLLWQNTSTGERCIWLMNGTAFASGVSLGVAPTEWSIAGAGDFNGDGQTDLLWTNSRTGMLSVWLMNGTAFASGVSLGVVSPELQVAGVGDYNGDGRPDILWTNTLTGERSVCLMNGTTAGSSVSIATIPLEWVLNRPVHRRVPADFNDDGNSDLVWQNTATGERSIWLMNRTAFQAGASLGVVPTDWSIAAIGDVNGDGKPDLLWQNAATGERVIWLMNGTAFASGVSLGVVPTDWVIAGAGDFNGDSKPDILWQNLATGERVIWLMNGTTFISGVSLGLVPAEWSIAAVADFNGDGKPDLVWQNTATGERSIWLMNGTTFMSGVSLGMIPIEWSIAGTGDFNGDGRTDLLWQDRVTGTRSIWLMNGTSFVSGVSLGKIPVEWSIRN